MRALLVELTRFRLRRAVALLVLLAVVVAAVLVGVIAWDTRPLSASERSDAAAQAQLEGQRSRLRAEVRACEADPRSYLGPSATAPDCRQALVPSAESYYPRHTLDLGRVLGIEGLHLALVVVGLMVVAGCTFAGADWSSGAMTNQLLFQPRRLRLWAAKAGAVTLGSGVVAVVVLGAFWLALWAVAAARGVDVSAADGAHVGWHLLRATILTMAAGLGGYALTMVFRHSVTTLALLFVYAVGGEIVANLVPIEGVGRFSLGNNIFGWLATNHHYFDPSLDCAPGDRCDPIQVMTHLEAGIFLGVLLAIAVVVSIVVFQRRDA